jgi:hypothetical protein
MEGVGIMREPDVAIQEVNGAIQELHAPYGNHVHHIEAIWELFAPGGRWMVPDMNCMAPAYPMETDCTMWEPHGMYGGHTSSVCTVWEPCAP